MMQNHEKVLETWKTQRKFNICLVCNQHTNRTGASFCFLEHAFSCFLFIFSRSINSHNFLFLQIRLFRSLGESAAQKKSESVRRNSQRNRTFEEKSSKMVKKTGRRKKELREGADLVVTFDPAARKEFLTGFYRFFVEKAVSRICTEF